MAKQQIWQSYEIEGNNFAIETSVNSAAESISVCSDSNYNQPATHTKRRTQNKRQNHD